MRCRRLSQCRSVIFQSAENFGRVDIAVVNASILRTGAFVDISEEDFDAVIRVNLKGMFLTGQAAVMSRTPMKHPAEPSEIASIAVFLASEDSSYITGQTIFADGGQLLLAYTC